MSADTPSNVPLADELTAVFARMSGFLLSQETVDTALRLVTSLAQSTLAGTVGAGVTLIDGQGRKTSAAASDALTERADNLQYELNEGPCLTAWERSTVVRIDDVAAEERWPRWCRAVQSLPVRSTLSTPLVVGGRTLGAIKVYGDQVDASDFHAEQVLTMFAAQAGILIANMQTLESARQLTDQLKEALESRDVIATAKGIVMVTERVDGEAAFARLVALSQREGKKLREVAEVTVQAAARRRR